MNKILQASLKFGWQRPGLRLLMAVGLIDTAFFSWAWYAWQPYFLKLLGMDAVWVAGVIAAVLSIAMIVGNGLVSLLARYFKRRTAAMTLAVTLYTGCAIGVGLTDDFMVAVTLFTFSVVMVGILRPVRQAYMHQSIPSSERATIISLDSMVGSTGGIVGQTGLGWLSQSGGFGLGYLIGGLFTGLMLPLTLRLRSRHEAIDEFHFNALAQEGTLKLSDLE
jgi:MFS family permease